MRTLRRVGTPSSSTLSEPRRLAMVPSSTTVTSSEATFWPSRPGEGRGLLAVEIALEPVADRLVEEDARPARPEHDRHASPAGASTAPSFITAWRTASRGEALPALLLEEEVEGHPPAAAEAADLPLAVRPPRSP